MFLFLIGTVALGTVALGQVSDDAELNRLRNETHRRMDKVAAYEEQFQNYSVDLLIPNLLSPEVERNVAALVILKKRGVVALPKLVHELETLKAATPESALVDPALHTKKIAVARAIQEISRLDFGLDRTLSGSWSIDKSFEAIDAWWFGQSEPKLLADLAELDRIDEEAERSGR